VVIESHGLEFGAERKNDDQRLSSMPMKRKDIAGKVAVEIPPATRHNRNMKR